MAEKTIPMLCRDFSEIHDRLLAKEQQLSGLSAEVAVLKAAYRESQTSLVRALGEADCIEQHNNGFRERITTMLASVWACGVMNGKAARL